MRNQKIATIKSLCTYPTRMGKQATRSLFDPRSSDLRDFQIKKYPKISCGAGILPANHQGRAFRPIPQDGIIYFLEFPKRIFEKYFW